MRFAIYGFFFKNSFSFKEFCFTPVENNLSFGEKVGLSKNKHQYNLTGYIDAQNIDSEEFIFTMQAVLTFVQQQDVIVRDVSDGIIPSEYHSNFERNGCAAPFAMYPDLQQEIIEKLYLKLIDKNDLCNQKDNDSVFGLEHNREFSSLVYKVIEPFHMRKNFVDISYYLYFSGLEAFCKQYLKSYYPEIKISTTTNKNLGEMLEKLKINYIYIPKKETDIIEDAQYNLKEERIQKDVFFEIIFINLFKSS